MHAVRSYHFQPANDLDELYYSNIVAIQKLYTLQYYCDQITKHNIQDAAYCIIYIVLYNHRYMLIISFVGIET